MDTLKSQRYAGNSLVDGFKEPVVTVTDTRLSAENALRRTQPKVSISENIEKVVNREFDKIRKITGIIK